MKVRSLAALAALAAFAAGCAAASPAPEPASPAPEAAGRDHAAATPVPESAFPVPEPAGREHAAAVFAKFKALAGSWKGEMGEGEHKNPMTVEYRVTGGGSAVEETLFRGTPHEMVTLYHLDGPRMLLTHYCAAGNQPTMLLVPGDDPAKPQFEFLRATNLEDPKAGHMHRAAFDLSQDGAITARWTFFHDGKAGDCAVIGVKRAE